MMTIVLVIQNPKEAVYLRQIFLKVNIKIISASPSYASYIKTLQYEPDLVIIEIPEEPKAHIQFLRIIRGNKAIEQIPFIAYGPQCDEQCVNSIMEAGADAYMTRPLDIKAMISNISNLVHSASKKKYQVEEKNQLSEDERGKLTDPSVSRSDKMEIMRKHIGNLMAFPATVASILRVSQSEKSGAGELAKVIRSDPAMSAEILKIANSVYFSRGGRRILDIKDAVVRIGFVQTKKIAMSLSVFKIAQNQNYATGFNHNQYWFHCLAVAIIAEAIAKNSQLISQEEAFITGLLHDLGTLLFNEYFNDLFLKVLEKTTDEGIRFIECEDELLGFNHNDLVAELFSEWKFPDILCADIKIICRSINLNKQFIDEHKLASVVTVADIIAKSFQIGRSVDCCIEPVSNEVMERLRYPYGIQPAFLNKVYSELNMYNQILNIDKKTFPETFDQVKDASEIKVLCYSFNNDGFIPVYEYMKTQGYQVSLSTNLTDLIEKVPCTHIAVLTGVKSDNNDDIRKLAEMKMLPFDNEKPSLESGAGNQNESSTEVDLTNRILVFGPDGDYLKQIAAPGIVSSMYSFDLRTIDIALRCLLYKLSTEKLTNGRGTLYFQKTVDSLKIIMEKKRILIGHFKNDIRAKIKECFSESEYFIEETNEGPKIVNYAKSLIDELQLIIIDLNIPMLSCIEVIRAIKVLPYHRRAKFLILFASCEKDQLVPLVKIGIRDFISEDASKEEIAKKLHEIGF